MNEPTPSETTIAILIQSPSSESRGQAHLRTVTRSEAMRKAIMVWLGSWLAAVGALPIPLVHFVVPPLLLLLGPVFGFAAFRIYNGATDITQGDAPCPECGVRVVIGPRAARWPFDLTCSSCEARLMARRDEAETKGAPA